MPYPPLPQPSLALGLLAASLEPTGTTVRSLYPCVWFADQIGLDAYTFIANGRQEFLLGEWTFAESAFPDFHPDHEQYLDAVCGAAVSQGLLARKGVSIDPREVLRDVRASTPGFIRATAQRVLAHDPKIVGCTSTFAQQCASLAILREIHELAPEVVTVMGGANCEGPMGLATKASFPWVDYVVSGEADLLFPELCDKALAFGRDIPPSLLPYGVLRHNPVRLTSGATTPRAVVDDMDATPCPDFDDYFSALHHSTIGPFLDPALAMETSRGCWWGQVHHCTFCGLNGGGMEFRSKTPQRVLDELALLSERYGIRRFNIVDNILDLKYIKNLLPELARVDPQPYVLFFETKANLKRRQLSTLADAGIRRVQPGIESMHDEILRLIDKGTTALQNVRLLKAARETGVYITWNFLWDVPGEQDDWYGEMADWLPLVTHLQPPGVDRIQFHRFSPYHFASERFGLTLEPYFTYQYVYPLENDVIEEMAYYFQDPRRTSAKSELQRRPHLRQVMAVLALWRNLWTGPDGTLASQKPLLLCREDATGALCITDTRPTARAAHRLLTGIERDVHNACDEIQSLPVLHRTLGVQHANADIEKAVHDLVEQGLLLRLDERLLSLAVHDAPSINDSAADFPAGTVDLTAWHASILETAPASPATNDGAGQWALATAGAGQPGSG